MSLLGIGLFCFEIFISGNSEIEPISAKRCGVKKWIGTVEGIFYMTI